MSSLGCIECVFDGKIVIRRTSYKLGRMRAKPDSRQLEVIPMAVQTLETIDEISLRVDGDLDLTSVPHFQSAMGKAAEMRGERALVVDLRNTDYIDSAGLEQLLMANRKLTAQGRRLRVRVVPGSQPQTVLTITGFNAVMDVESDDGIS